LRTQSKIAISYEAEAAGGKRACKMIAKSLLQSHDHKNQIQ